MAPPAPSRFLRESEALTLILRKYAGLLNSRQETAGLAEFCTHTLECTLQKDCNVVGEPEAQDDLIALGDQVKEAVAIQEID